MTDHVHELGQGFNIAHMEEYVWCITCKERWSKVEITRRLNATERLSADAAKAIVQDAQDGAVLRIASTHYLVAYAAAREGGE